MHSSKSLVIFSVTVLMSVVAGCSGSGPFDVRGTMSVPAMSSNLDDYPPMEPGDPCFIPDDQKYSGVDFGTQVLLKDSTGAVVGTSSLGLGKVASGWSESGEWVHSDETFVWDTCVYEFRFSEVESDDEFFSVEVGTRGEISFSKEDLLLRGANVALPRLDR